LLLKSQDTALRNQNPLTGVKKGAFTEPFSVSKVKAKAKSLNCTLNDVLFAVTSVTFEEYLRSRGDKTDYINIVCPFTLRRLPNSAEELKLDNDFAPVPIVVPVEDNFNVALKKVQHTMEQEKKSFNAYGTYYLF